ncbi:lipopolysaccharide assembly protein LapA domain-containing protein [Glutamicibacter sp. JC586]|uniref:lipopolysaccharide assembly protein LapA domain-containing protein n=1 Tax=Glutamicibacter sp. JC586 TaxID=2590552 RepID=UPI0013579C46|nr:LapA family protein [Glutamicibacter sp. JC586]
MTDPERKQGRFALNTKQITAIVLVVLALVFILQNLTYVRVEFFFIHSSAPLWLILVITLALGYVIGWISKRRD